MNHVQASRADPRALEPCCLQTRGTASDPDPPEGWSRRDWNVLLELARGDDAHVGFQGLKRRLDLHPEALRRTLTRLVESGAVTKTSLGYRLTDQGHDHAQGAMLPRPTGPSIVVAAFLLPASITLESVERQFAGKWFDGLHWYGAEPGPAQSVLRWLAPEGAFVKLNAGQGALRIEVAGHDDPDRLVLTAAPLVASVAAWLRNADPGQRSRMAS